MWLTYWSNKNNTKKGIFLSYLILFFFLALRYDIGYDYSSYVYSIKAIIREFRSDSIPFYNWGDSEPLFSFLSFIFMEFPYPHAYVIGTYALIWTIFIYKTFDYYNNHSLGILIIFIIGFVFVEMDQMRQGTAIAVFLYSIRFIKESDFKKYLLCILFATIIHYSALILIIFYFANKYKPKKKLYAIIIILLFMFFNSNLSTQWYEFIVTKYISHYSLFDYKTAKALEQFDTINYRIRTAYYCLIWIIIIYTLPEKDRGLVNILFIGVVIFIISSGAMNIRRMANYLTFTMSISIPIIIKNKRFKLIIGVLVFGLFLFFIRDMIVGKHQGCIPYESIFSEDFLSGKLSW